MLQECAMVKLTESSRVLPQKIKHTPRDQAVPHLGVYPEEQKTKMERSGCHVPSNRASAGG